MTLGHSTKNCKDLRNIIHDFIDQKEIQINDTPKKEDKYIGPIHPDNSQLCIFKYPLTRPIEQPKGCIGIVCTPNYFQYYFSNTCFSYHSQPRNQ